MRNIFLIYCLQHHKPIATPANQAVDGTGAILRRPLTEDLKLVLLCEQASVHQIDRVNRQLRIVQALVVDIIGIKNLTLAVPTQLSNLNLPLSVVKSFAARMFSELVKKESMIIHLTLAKQFMGPIVTTIADDFPARILHFSDSKCSVT